MDDISDCAVTVCWLVFLCFRFPLRCSTPHREKGFIPDRTRLSVNSRVTDFFRSFNMPRKRQEFDSRNREDSIRDESGKIVRARHENRALIISILLGPEIIVCLSIYASIDWLCFVRCMFLSENVCFFHFSHSNNFSTFFTSFYASFFVFFIEIRMRGYMYIRLSADSFLIFGPRVVPYACVSVHALDG